jgi:hypothetical protein
MMLVVAERAAEVAILVATAILSKVAAVAVAVDAVLSRNELAAATLRMAVAAGQAED